MFTTESAMDTALGSELRRVGLTPSDAKRLQNEAIKIAKQCGHNIDLMTRKLMDRTRRDVGLRSALHEVYMKAIFRDIEPDKHIVKPHVRGNPSPAADTATAPVKARRPNPEPNPRPVGQELQDVWANIYATSMTSDRKLWANLSYADLVSRARDGGIAQRLLNHIGAQPDEHKTVAEMVSPQVFAELIRG